ncbi:MAG: type II toxin-antitoxin system Phd/YefM family antitoxin [Rickettsiales bacterium]
MEHISSFDAKTHFSRLLADVVAGKEYIITRHNKEVAKLTKFSSKQVDVDNAINMIKKNRVKSKISLTEILKYRDQGRR